MAQVLSAIGTIFAVVSAFLIYRGFQVEIIVPAAQLPGAGGMLPPQFDGVANLSLMHTQAMLFHLGIGSAIVSAVFFAGAGVAATLRERPED